MAVITFGIVDFSRCAFAGSVVMANDVSGIPCPCKFLRVPVEITASCQLFSMFSAVAVATENFPVNESETLFTFAQTLFKRLENQTAPPYPTRIS